MAPIQYKSSRDKGVPDDIESVTSPRPNKDRVPPKRLLIIITALFWIWALREPLSQCYHRVVEHDCSNRRLSVEQRVEKILSHHPLIDGHVDLPVAIRLLNGNHIDNVNFTEPFEDGTYPGSVDLARLREGLSGGAFWSVYADCPADPDDFSDENYAKSVQFTLDQIDLVSRLRRQFPDDFSGNVGSESALKAFKQGKLISPMGVEGLHQIGNRVANLRHFHDLGARYVTLTHNCHNKYADAAVIGNPPAKAKPLWGGLSSDGRKLVHEMNRIGMIVDISHVSEDTMIDVLGGRKDWEGSKAPVMFSHSSSYTLCPHPRNAADKILQLVKNSNSVIMVNAVPDFISCASEPGDNGIPEADPEHATLDKYVEHIMHIGAEAGWDHVGIGTDFDGALSFPKGFEDVTKYKDLFAALLRNGVSDADAAKVAGGNILRVWKDVEDVAEKLQAEGFPILEDDLPKFGFPE